MLNMFVDEGATVYSNNIAHRARHPQGRLLAHPRPRLHRVQHRRRHPLQGEGLKDIAGNYSFVNGSIKGLYAKADLLWSAKIRRTSTSSTAPASASACSSATSRTTGSNRTARTDPLSAANGHSATRMRDRRSGRPGQRLQHGGPQEHRHGTRSATTPSRAGSTAARSPSSSLDLASRSSAFASSPSRTSVPPRHGLRPHRASASASGAYGLEQKPKE